MTKKSDSKKIGNAAIAAGAAIGSAALAAAVLYASKRKEKVEDDAPKAPPSEPLESD